MSFIKLEYQSVEKTVEYKGDPIPVVFTLFDADYGSDLLTQLAQLFAPILDPLLASSKDIEGKLDVSFSKLLTQGVGKLVQEMITQKGSKTISGLIQKIVSSAFVDGYDMSNKNNYKILFSGRAKLLFKVLILILKENYSDFFEEGVGQLPSNLQEMVGKTLNLNKL